VFLSRTNATSELINNVIGTNVVRELLETLFWSGEDKNIGAGDPEKGAAHFSFWYNHNYIPILHEFARIPPRIRVIPLMEQDD
jgi:hypothetical protein